MKTTDKAVAVSPRTTKTKYDAVLSPHVTIAQVLLRRLLKLIESSMQRFHTPKLMEYVTHGNRAGVEAYVDSTSKPMAIFWDFEQGSTMRLAGIPIESKFYLVGNAVIAAWFVPIHRCRRLGRSRAYLRVPAGRRGDTDRHGPTVGILQQIPRDTAIDCTRSARRDVDKALRGCRCIGQHDEESCMARTFFLRCEMRLIVLCFFAALTARAQTTAEHLPVTGRLKKLRIALRAAPKFITDGATIVDYPAGKGGEFRILP